MLNALIGIEVAKTEIYVRRIVGKAYDNASRVIQLPSGALVIDTPGMRELQLWEGSEAIQTTFSDIEELATTCRFRDCKHENEPGCAVYSAIENGLITIDRLKAIKLQRELAYFIRKQDAILARAERDKWKKLSKQHKNVKPKGHPLVFYCKFYNNIIYIYRQREVNCLNFTKYSS